MNPLYGNIDVTFTINKAYNDLGHRHYEMTAPAGTDSYGNSYPAQFISPSDVALARIFKDYEIIHSDLPTLEQGEKGDTFTVRFKFDDPPIIFGNYQITFRGERTHIGEKDKLIGYGFEFTSEEMLQLSEILAKKVNQS